MLCGAQANSRTITVAQPSRFSGSRRGMVVERCFRVWREQAILKRSGGALARAALGRAAGVPVVLGERRGRNVVKGRRAGAKRKRTVGGS